MNAIHTHDENIDPAKIRLVPIPDSSRHDVIYSTLCGMDGKIYIGVSSEFHPQGYARLMVYDPRTGQSRPGGQVPRAGARAFTPPQVWPDWVLVLDDAARDYPTPGRP